jgi:high-affinity nickel-transport protein
VGALSQTKHNLGSRLLLGASWGIGHTLTLLLVGGGLALFEAEMPAQVSLGLELAVGVMIIALGLAAIRRALKEGRLGHTHFHSHGGLAHAHSAPLSHFHLSRWTLATRPLLVGAMHGLAGSGAITAMVLVELHGPWTRLGYILLFGLGSVAGMGALSALAGWPLERLRESKRAATFASMCIGLGTTALGSWWAWSAAAGLLAQ